MHLKFSVPGSSRVMDIKAIVKWSTTEIARKTFFGGYGMMFSSISTEDLEELRAFISAEARRLGLEEEPSQP